MASWIINNTSGLMAKTTEGNSIAPYWGSLPPHSRIQMYLSYLITGTELRVVLQFVFVQTCGHLHNVMDLQFDDFGQRGEHTLWNDLQYLVGSMFAWNTVKEIWTKSGQIQRHFFSKPFWRKPPAPQSKTETRWADLDCWPGWFVGEADPAQTPAVHVHN